MIVLDTHIWVWWVHGSPDLPPFAAALIQHNEDDGLAVSAISCWEVAKLVELGRLTLPFPIDEWMDAALAPAGIHLIDLTPNIAIEATRLPPPFHRDPADQIIVATARTVGATLLTLDSKILAYRHVKATNGAN